MAFEYLAERAAGDRLAVVLDEFPYLVESDPALPSVLQRFWDQRGRRSRLQLILCGSARSIMLKLQSENAPLFGRVDTRLHVRPFGYAEAGLFVPDIPPAERAIAYLGGALEYTSLVIGYRALLPVAAALYAFAAPAGRPHLRREA